MPVGLFVLAMSVLGVVAGTLVGRMPWETPSSATAQFRSAQTYRLESGHTYDIYSKVLLLEDACTVTPQGGTGAVLRQDLDLDSAVVQDEALWVPVLTFRVSAAGEYRLSCEAGHPMLLADPQQIPDQHRQNTAVMGENDADVAVLLGAFLGLPLGAVLCGVGSARRRRCPGEGRQKTGRNLTVLGGAMILTAIGLAMLTPSAGIPGGQSFSGSREITLPADAEISIYRAEWMSGPYPQKCTVEAVEAGGDGRVRPLPLDTASTGWDGEALLRPVATVRTGEAGTYRVSCPDGKKATAAGPHRMWTADHGIAPGVFGETAAVLLLPALLLLILGPILWIVGHRRMTGKGRWRWV